MNKCFSLSIILVSLTSFLLIVSYVASPALGLNVSSFTDDWPMFRYDPAHTGYSTSSAPATSALLWEFSTSGNQVDSSPAVVNGRVYVGSSSGNVYCIDALTGTQIWVNFKIQDDIYSSPAVVNGKVYFGSFDNKVYCLDAQTGNEL